MAYSPTTWTTGDTISASALNKIEQGIAGAGSGGTACVRISASGFASGEKIFGYVAYAYLDNGSWVLASDNTPFKEIDGNQAPFDALLVIPLPNDENVGVFLVDSVNDGRSITGDISVVPTTLYFSWGSAYEGSYNAYRITGNGSYEFIAT